MIECVLPIRIDRFEGSRPAAAGRIDEIGAARDDVRDDEKV